MSRVVTGESWRAELAAADFVVLALPLTPATEDMIDVAAFDAMKPGAWLVNVARGGLVEESALLAALDDGHLGGAVLDAFTEEPLPPDHALWGRPNVLVLPHATWSSPDIRTRFASQFAAQLRRWAHDVPLDDVVDLLAGY